MKKYKSDRAFDIVNGLIIAILCVTFILPFWMMIISSFTEEISLRVNGYKLFPSAFSAAGYEYIFSSSDYNILRAIINSVIISVSGTVLSVAVSLITAYALSKKYVVGIKGINVFYIITMFFAGGTIPLYLVIRGIGLYDTIWALIIPSMFSLYHIILVRSYFYSLPAALEEAAMIDGCNPLQIFFKIVFPILKPTMISTAILETMWVWNDYLLPTLVLDIKKYRTIPMAIQYFRGSYGRVEMGPMMACIMITVLPIIVMYLVCQKYIIDGVIAGAVKG